MLAAGELFTLIAYAQLILENRSLYAVDDDLLSEIFAFLVRDFSAYALQMVLRYENSTEQEVLFQAMIKKPVADAEAFARVWCEQVLTLKDCYVMNE